MNKSNMTMAVYLLDISPHNKAILEFFIAGSGKAHFVLVNVPEKADVFVTDFDVPSAMERWENDFSGYSKPLILMAIKNPLIENTIWIKKPLTSMALINAKKTISKQFFSTKVNQPSLIRDSDAVLLQETLSTNTLGSSNKQSVVNIVAPITKKRSLFVETKETVADPNGRERAIKNQLKRWDQLLGDQDALSLDDLKQLDSNRYIANDYLLGNLVSAARLSRKSNQAVLIEIDTSYLVVDAENDCVISNYKLTSAVYKQLCNTPLTTGQLRMTMPDVETITPILEHLNSVNPQNREGILLENDLNSIESWLWTSAILTSAGRLPIDISVEQLLACHAWPNFPRIENFPEALKIAAYWHNQARTIKEVTKNINCSLVNVVAFINGVYALDLIEYDKRKLRASKQNNKHKNKGFLSRLFNRLLKGG